MKIKHLLLISGFIAILTILYAFTSKATITDKVMNESEWKNLKVLPSTISNDSLKTLMKGYNKALGVKCNYCHSEDPSGKKGELDFASDSKKEKEFARHMILMTRKINAENFNWQNSPDPEKIDVVSCTMCHRGTAKPSESLR